MSDGERYSRPARRALSARNSSQYRERRPDLRGHRGQVVAGRAARFSAGRLLFATGRAGLLAHLEWEVVPDWSALLRRLPGRRLVFQQVGQPRLSPVAVTGRGMCWSLATSRRGCPTACAAAGEGLLRIPIRPQVRSLNLSNAVAIVLYEGCGSRKPCRASPQPAIGKRPAEA